MYRIHNHLAIYYTHKFGSSYFLNLRHRPQTVLGSPPGAHRICHEHAFALFIFLFH
jgi:hypothetical protein